MLIFYQIFNNNCLFIIKVDESEDSADMPRHHLTFTKLEKCVDSGKVVGKFMCTYIAVKGYF
jgi:hypothetical protein